MLQAMEVGLLQGLVDVEVRALAQCRLLGNRLRGVRAGAGRHVVQAALRPAGPVRAVDAAAAAAPAAVAARRLEGKRDRVAIRQFALLRTSLWFHVQDPT